MERVRWETGSLAWTLIGTTLGGGVIILGVVAILGCRSVKLGCVRLNRMSRIDWVGALRSTAGVGGEGTLVVGGASDRVGGSMSAFRIQLLKISRSLEMTVSCSW